ncbi:MAG: type I-E CRISPR-associated protein Cse1/CasA [Bacteroidetes bacterium]|jgi:CRISPR system Cascade subunit CasA|nr:type I-E CRISPR-associated protein Cse1/CasA [Bacteroidota bacterium]
MSDDMNYSLLDDPVITVRFQDGQTSKTNLPEIFSGLMADSVVSFEALQPHQQQPWYSFLVQLAAMAVARENKGDIPTEPERWRELLVSLAGGSEAAWHLVVADPSKPAFMQPPIPEGSLEEAGYSSDIQTPDDLDMLVTSKNHDVKGNRILRPEPQHWLFALLTLQTMEGFLGRGNYGIIRMNGGFGNRPFVGLSNRISWDERFKRDLNVLLKNRPDLLNMYATDGYALLWLPFWDGSKTSGIPISSCDPFFIEICRRIRFQLSDGNMTCFRTNTKASRISAPDDLNGRTEDPWTPIEKKGVKALTLGESGFTYELIQQLLLGEEYSTPQALEFQEDEQHGAFLISQAMVRGQGKTDGLHRRIIPVPPKISSQLFGNTSTKETLAKRAKQRISLTYDVQRKVLWPSISSLLSSGSGNKVDYEKVAPWINRFDSTIDQRFFEALWVSVEMDQEEARQQWSAILFEEAEKIYKEAERSTPITQLRRYRAISKARGMFYGQAKKVLEVAGNEKPITQ